LFNATAVEGPSVSSIKYVLKKHCTSYPAELGPEYSRSVSDNTVATASHETGSSATSTARSSERPNDTSSHPILANALDIAPQVLSTELIAATCASHDW
jgi:hypothetical protein